jgi:hypothetical protein
VEYAANLNSNIKKMKTVELTFKKIALCFDKTMPHTTAFVAIFLEEPISPNWGRGETGEIFSLICRMLPGGIRNEHDRASVNVIESIECCRMGFDGITPEIFGSNGLGDLTLEWKTAHFK